jgi:hypothetical protein
MQEKVKKRKGVETKYARDVVTDMSVYKTEYDSPVMDVTPYFDDLTDVSTLDGMPPIAASKVVSSMDDKHAWAIYLDPRLVTKCEVNGAMQHFLIGYENGLTARKNETHFTQKETDPVAHRLFFHPEPHFISYSFFYGFFGKTIRDLCATTLETSSAINISNRKSILKQFCDKYVFAFSKNKHLEKTMQEYAEALIENIVDVQAKVGEK